MRVLHGPRLRCCAVINALPGAYHEFQRLASRRGRTSKFGKDSGRWTVVGGQWGFLATNCTNCTNWTKGSRPSPGGGEWAVDSGWWGVGVSCHDWQIPDCSGTGPVLWTGLDEGPHPRPLSQRARGAPRRMPGGGRGTYHNQGGARGHGSRSRCKSFFEEQNRDRVCWPRANVWWPRATTWQFRGRTTAGANGSVSGRW